MFHTINKNYQNKHLAKTWQNKLSKREVCKNNYHATGDIKKAKAFISTFATFSFKSDFAQTVEHVIFSSDALAVPLPAYAYI